MSGYGQDALFGVDPQAIDFGSVARKKWGGSVSTRMRKALALTLPTPCWRCSRMITADDKWHVGHLTDRALGGDDNDVAVECAACNLSAGGKLGAAITNGRKVRVQTSKEKTVKWY